MNSTEEVTFDAPAKKKPAKKRAKARPAAKEKPAAPFPGMTRTVCAAACNASGCVISGKAYCAHPNKGGLQAADQSDPAAKNRIQRAREQLDIRLDPDRFR